MIKFKAIFHKVSSDKEGEGTLTLKIPTSDLPGLLPILTMMEKVLDVEIKEEG